MRAFLTREARECLRTLRHLCLGVCDTRGFEQRNDCWDSCRGTRWSTYHHASHDWCTDGSSHRGCYLVCLLQSVSNRWGVIGEDKDWRGGNLFLENVKGGLFFGAPFPFIAEDTDMEFKTAWNAGVIMHMQNASRPLEQNLGLAKDVPCFSNHFTTHLHTDMENRWKREGLG